LNAFPEFLFSSYLGKGLGLLAEVRREANILNNVTSVRAEGDGRLQAVVYQRAGREERIATDLLLLHTGVIPNLNLANATGCAQAWDPIQRCFRPRADPWGASSVEGVSMAGAAASVLGAKPAAYSGRISALSALCRLG